MDIDQVEDEYEGEDEGGGSEDDDGSWKVRKAAVKVLSAIVNVRQEKLLELHGTLSHHLIDRFKEREENVRLDVLTCFTNLLSA
eukprot:gene14869-20109_t